LKKAILTFLTISIILLSVASCSNEQLPEGSKSNWIQPETGIYYSNPKETLFYNYDSRSWGTSRAVAVKYNPEDENNMTVFFDMDLDGSFSGNEVFACNVEGKKHGKGKYLQSDFDQSAKFIFCYDTSEERYQLIYIRDNAKKWLQVLSPDMPEQTD